MLNYSIKDNSNMVKKKQYFTPDILELRSKIFSDS